MIFFDSKKLIDNVIEDLSQAKESIDIEVYIWDPDDVGKLFEDVLIKAVERGVKVRVIVDRIGSLAWIQSRMDTLIAKGVMVRVFRPIPGLKTIFKYLPQILIPFFSVINRRNHRKVFLVDKKIVYVGSLNIMEPALRWKETTVRLENHKEISVINEIFESTWKWIENASVRFNKMNFKKVVSEVMGSTQVRTTQTKELRAHYRKDFINYLNAAQKRVWLVTPYFNPPGFLLKTLIAASKRGCDVRLIIPCHTDPSWFKYLSRLYYSKLLKEGIAIYEYQPGILHAKTTLVDDQATVGSGNLNYRSFYQDLELNLSLTDEKSIQDLNNEFLSDMTKSQRITNSNEIKIWERVFGSFLVLFKTSF